jgi:hypothetical protein
MQKLTLYQVDAFTSRLFGGNPAAVIPLENWLDDRLMQLIAEENNLSETVFLCLKKMAIILDGLLLNLKLIYAVMLPWQVLLCFMNI